MTRLDELNRVYDKMQADEAKGLPRDMDAFRFALARYLDWCLAEDLRTWQRCGERACRRAKSCMTSLDECPLLPPVPEMTPEENAKWRAELYDALEARVAEIELGEADGIDQHS